MAAADGLNLGENVLGEHLADHFKSKAEPWTYNMGIVLKGGDFSGAGYTYGFCVRSNERSGARSADGAREHGRTIECWKL